MKVIYNSVVLSDIGDCQIAGEAVEREPAEAPVRERHVLRVRLDFFHSTYEANAAAVAQVRAAITTQQARLVVQRGDGTAMIDRDVTVLSDDEPGDGREPNAGTTRQAITLAFRWEIALTALQAAAKEAEFTPTDKAKITLGGITDWREAYSTERFDPFKPARRRTAGALEASGSFTSNEADADTRSAALLAAKDAAEAAVNSAADGVMVYGTFSRKVRVERFEARVNQPLNRVEFSISCAWTQYPDESSFSLLEYNVSEREHCRDGSADRTVSGKIIAPTAAAATARLATLKTDLTLPGYALSETDSTTQQAEAESGSGSDGEIFTALSFTLEWRRIGTVGAVYTPTTVGNALTLGFVEGWSERYQTERFIPMASARRRTAGSVDARGWFTVSDTLDLATRQATLLAAKDAAVAAVNSAPDGTLAFGTFSQKVRVERFDAVVNQPRHRIEWTMACAFTSYPDESAFKLVEYNVAEREHYRDGSAEKILSGRIIATDLARARAKLTSLQAQLAASDYAPMEAEQTQQLAASESGVNGGDGEVLVALNFSQEWRRIGALKPTFQRDGGTLMALGAVDGWSERLDNQLYDEMRPQRRRSAGVVEARGWLGGTNEDSPTNLVALKTALMVEFQQGAQGTLVFGDFSQSVRIAGFRAEINQPKHRIEWTLTCTWTRFPDETNYALCEFNVEDATDHETGLISKRFGGRIGAPDSAAARAKLTALRALFAGSYTLASEQTSEQRIDAGADGATFISLSFADVWRPVVGDVLHYDVRVGEADDLRSGWVRQTWSGRVTARGATQDAAYAAAVAKARELGADKQPYRLGSHIHRVLPMLQTAKDGAGTVIQNPASPAPLVTVEFSFEYQVRGTGSHAEWASSVSTDNFSRSAETISGVITAPTAEAARALYATIKATYATALQLTEQLADTQEIAAPIGVATGQAVTSQHWVRLGFSLSLHKAKTAISASYTLETEADYIQMERRTIVRGQVWGASADACTTWLDGTLIPALNANSVLGTHSLNSRRAAATITAQSPAGVMTAGFVGQEFSESFTKSLTGYDGIVECSVAESIRHSGNRLVEKMLPDDRSLIQSVGTTMGERSVAGTVRAVTKATCSDWAARCRRLLLSGSGTPAYEHPPELEWNYEMIPLTTGIPVLDGATAANVKCHTLRFRFREWVKELDYGQS